KDTIMPLRTAVFLRRKRGRGADRCGVALPPRRAEVFPGGISCMNGEGIRGHAAMLGANVMWGLMSPLAKYAMNTGAVTPMTITELRVAGAMVLFWMASLFGPRERVAPRDLLRLFA